MICRIRCSHRAVAAHQTIPANSARLLRADDKHLPLQTKSRAIPHNSKCRYGERGAADAKPKAQIILCVLSSILATQMPCRTPSRSEALRSATDALRRLLARRSAGAVLKPLGGNCAVLPLLYIFQPPKMWYNVWYEG